MYRERRSWWMEERLLITSKGGEGYWIIGFLLLSVRHFVDAFMMRDSFFCHFRFSVFVAAVYC